MYDRFNRKINYLRISVTDKCNLNCEYCSSGKYRDTIKLDSILSFEEISDFVRISVRSGIDKVRLTGGEPLVRKDIISLVIMLAGIQGINDLSMTTNGILLEHFAVNLKKAGLMRINVSLDTTDENKYRIITGGGDINKVMSGLAAAKATGFEVIKLNCVVEKSADEIDAMQVAQFAERNGFIIRFIKKMNLAEGRFWPVDGGEGGKCRLCNRLRLSSDGRLYPCLFCNTFFSIKELGAEEAIRQAVHFKPESGKMSDNKIHVLGG